MNLRTSQFFSPAEFIRDGLAMLAKLIISTVWHRWKNVPPMTDMAYNAGKKLVFFLINIVTNVVSRNKHVVSDLCLTFVPTKFMCWSLFPMWWYLEVGFWGGNQAIRMEPSREIGTLIWRDVREMVALSLSTTWGRSTKTATPEKCSHKTPLYWYLDLKLPASRTMRNKCLFFKLPSL